MADSEGARPTSVLVVQHEDGAPAGWFGEHLEAAGLRLDVRRPYAGDALPPLTSYDGLLVLGGAMDSWDDEGTPWLPAVRALVRAAATTRTPALGICLGHQLAGLALGGGVERNPGGATVGLQAVGWLPEAAADPLIRSSTGATTVAHWNSDVLTELPDGTVVLARSADGAVQIARLTDTVWGVQCHPEVDAAIVRTWVEEELPRVADEPSRGPLNRYVAEMEQQEKDLRTQWEPLADAFAGLVRDGVA
ncbi:type 1 glutamine amidotransferase [Nocardioides marmoribigeumensis]|uniref:GMP synthase (Glutamine-hydrolyzing) n=1 Tax=Nocardioides marmoribigeumensis TaxID=433649 RepID=A0ABU2BQ28_9ACTN|nr:type 1 glutamine amidotransferase [Nocardioides marmoribigeumensis]MDR7360736.1 GMP synthase (glutamine-hydrolyzing) [Nocardioides marmoribigeumensis]